MCIEVSFQSITTTDLLAYKGVKRIYGKDGRFISPVTPNHRAPQGLDLEVGDIVEYVLGAAMTDEEGIGYFLYADYAVAAARFKDEGEKILLVKIPSGTEIICGRDAYNCFAIIAKTVEVLHLVSKDV